MPRLVFSSAEDLLRWATEQASSKPGNYVVIHTGEDELILHQTVSTRPIFVGYYKGEGAKDAVSILKDMGFSIYDVVRVEWDVERGLKSYE